MNNIYFKKGAPPSPSCQINGTFKKGQVGDYYLNMNPRTITLSIYPRLQCLLRDSFQCKHAKSGKECRISFQPSQEQWDFMARSIEGLGCFGCIIHSLLLLNNLLVFSLTNLQGLRMGCLAAKCIGPLPRTWSTMIVVVPW